jgi:ABC-type polysaccharide transport system permease subunit
MSPVPAVFAILLMELKSRKLSRIVQTFSTFPNFFSWIIVYAVFFAVFSTQDGVLNIILMRLGFINEPTDVLINNDISWIVQTLVGLYKNMGYGAIIYIAAIAGINSELFDAADVDGAGRFRKIFHITIPCLMPTFIVLLILSVGNLLSAGGFDQYYVFSNPFVVDKLEVIDTYTYKVGIQQNNYSFATAVGLMKSVVSVLLVFSANYVSRFAAGKSII